MNPPIPQNPEPSAPPLGEIDRRTFQNLDDDLKEMILSLLEEDLSKAEKRTALYDLLKYKIEHKQRRISVSQEYLDNPFMNFDAQESAREQKEKDTRVMNYYQKKQANIQDDIVRKSMTLKFMRRYFY